ncbi:Smg-4/UPF3 family-domain-containing protein [Phyllosticta citribraziliensis]|uniref:Smg-4/UPF3 family-domain-containing protein n=1 Tax=Phyllosticta citribraziliensis TaxID=989973 RepID=A0ABR1LQ63_9PEZI
MAPPAAPAAAGTNGVLPVPATVLQKTNNKSSDNPARGSSNRSNAPRLKVVVRRLPPGLTQTEFEVALGEEWKLGAGKVDWFSYKPGKISKDLAKPSKPSRAYLHITDQASLAILADKVRKTAFHDAKNTTKDPALVGPPSLEFAPYTRIPAGRRRNDARQGLIDQDPEFKDFLESLTNPVTKPTPTDVTSEGPDHKEDIKTTPLIEHLKEKKAAKEKPQTSKSQGKKAESKDDKAVAKTSDKKGGRKGGKEVVTSSEKPAKQSKTEKGAKEAAPKEPVKILNKDSKAAPSPAPASSSDNAKPSGAPLAERKRERGNANLVKQMLQRDLGIGPAAGGRRSKREAGQEAAKPSETASPAESATPPAAPSTPVSGKNSPDTRSPKKDSRPTRAERRAQKAAKSGTETPAEQPKNGTSTPPAGPKILKKPAASSQQQQKPAPATSAPAPTNQVSEGGNASSKATTNSQQQPATQGRQQNSRNSPTSPVPAPTSKQAFLKHANASQGITEPLIETALGAYGTVVRVEIDKRKGFAYVDFAEPSGLHKAVAASPIKIAEGAVQVLERKDRPQQRVAAKGGAPAAPPTGPAQGSGRSGGLRGGRGGRGRGNGANATPAAKTAAPAADTPS